MTTISNRILFDYDGTLIIHNKDTEGDIIAGLLNIPIEKKKEFIKRLSLLFETAYGREYYAKHKMTYELFYEIVEIIMGPLSYFGVTAKQVVEAIDTKAIYMTELAPNAVETLEYLKSKNFELCVFTNGFYKAQSKNMKEHGISKYFEKIYAWDDWYAKPDIRAIKRALDGTDPKRNIMVGDSLTSDIIPAQRCGVFTIGYNIENLNAPGPYPDIVIKDLIELKERY